MRFKALFLSNDFFFLLERLLSEMFAIALTLRHSFGERLTESDVPWDWKQALLGHNPKEVTWRYSHYYKGKVNLFKLLEFVERLVRYSYLDEAQKIGRVALLKC